LRYASCLSFLLALYAPLWAVQAHSVFSVTPFQRVQILKEYDPDALRRLDDFADRLARLRALEPARRMNELNTYVNGYRSEYDGVIHRREEYWATPREFLIAGYGDCEEYAMTKYFALLELGQDPQSLCLGIVRDRYSGGGHMVLLIFENALPSPLVLDNLSFKILPMSQRSDLTFESCFDAAGRYTIDASGRKKGIGGKERRFENLIKRIEAGR